MSIKQEGGSNRRVGFFSAAVEGARSSFFYVLPLRGIGIGDRARRVSMGKSGSVGRLLSAIGEGVCIEFNTSDVFLAVDYGQ